MNTMLIAYRPELENPPREGGFGIITDSGLIQLSPGVNPEVPDSKWALARQNLTVKRLMAIGAIEELKAQPTVQDIPQSVHTLSQLPLTEALRMIEIMHDDEQLNDWKKIEGRIRVRNAIHKRVEAIRTGKV
jgi:hypothetical protein